MSAEMLHGDCRDVMATLDAASVDAIVCDPPYGLSFMGKGWDHGVPGVEFWQAALRVAKPGAYLVAFGGTRTYHRLACAIEDAGWEVHDCLSWLYGSGFPKHASKLKPGWEPAILARKPAPRATPLQIDACRIAGDMTGANYGGKQRTALGYHGGTAADGSFATQEHPAGRWPANVLLDEAAADGMGDPARYFYCAKASRKEREAGCDGLSARGVFAEGDRERPKGPPGSVNERLATKPARNHHPTVKPLAVMRWLVRLVTPPGGLVLDPFTGSGSTGVACVQEGLRFVGIEREPEYVAIAAARIAHAQQIAQPSLLEPAA